MTVKAVTIKYYCNCDDISYIEKPTNDGIKKEGKRMHKWHKKMAKNKSQELVEEISYTWRLIKNDWKIN